MPRSDPQKEAPLLARLAPFVPDLTDVAALLGLALLVAGVALMHVPSALIVAGLALLIIGVIGAMRSSDGR